MVQPYVTVMTHGQRSAQVSATFTHNALQADSNGVVQQHYDNAYRRVEQQIDTATRAVASERPSPTKPYPARPKTRVSAF